jgi:septum formation protein
MTDLPAFILASRSPQRQELLRRAGYSFRVVGPPVHEPPTHEAHATPAQLAEALAYFKARSVFRDHGDRLVLGADTVAALDGRIYGKAETDDDARRILSDFAGRRQDVITGLALLWPSRQPGRAPERLIASETTHVTMRPCAAEEIDRYVASGEWRDKAGAYAIQETGDAFVEKVEGSFTNVVGLPMELLERMLRQVGRGESKDT